MKTILRQLASVCFLTLAAGLLHAAEVAERKLGAIVKAARVLRDRLKID